MNKKVINLNVKSRLNDIVSGISGGVVRQYIKVDDPQNKNEKIIFFSAQFVKNKIDVFIEVKYKYLRRDKRIEIVTLKDNLISLYKISKTQTLDKDAIEIDQILTNIKLEYKNSNFKFIGNLIIGNIESELIINSINNALLNEVNFIIDRDLN
ncbi:hypothetical protein N8310_09080 [Pseudomonadota bacterium]|nr:hypothetical protein [Pseudomonadota bacterium]